MTGVMLCTVCANKRYSKGTVHLLSDAFRKQYDEVRSHVCAQVGCMRWTVMYGMDQSVLALILYQDAFEVVNPLGSARK